jgi:hypothetical protein
MCGWVRNLVAVTWFGDTETASKSRFYFIVKSKIAVIEDQNVMEECSRVIDLLKFSLAHNFFKNMDRYVLRTMIHGSSTGFGEN